MLGQIILALLWRAVLCTAGCLHARFQEHQPPQAVTTKTCIQTLSNISWGQICSRLQTVDLREHVSHSRNPNTEDSAVWFSTRVAVAGNRSQESCQKNKALCAGSPHPKHKLPWWEHQCIFSEEKKNLLWVPWYIHRSTLKKRAWLWHNKMLHLYAV